MSRSVSDTERNCPGARAARVVLPQHGHGAVDIGRSNLVATRHPRRTLDGQRQRQQRRKQQREQGAEQPLR